MNLKPLEEEINKLAHKIKEKYYGKTASFYWAGEIGDVLTLNDEFYDLRELLEIARANPTSAELFNYYEQREKKNAKPLTHFVNG